MLWLLMDLDRVLLDRIGRLSQDWIGFLWMFRLSLGLDFVRLTIQRWKSSLRGKNLFDQRPAGFDFREISPVKDHCSSKRKLFPNWYSLVLCARSKTEGIVKKIVHLSMSAFRLNRLAFKAHTAAEAANHSSYYRSFSWQERLKIAAYLNSIAFNYPEPNPPKLDRTRFKAVARKN